MTNPYQTPDSRVSDGSFEDDKRYVHARRIRYEWLFLLTLLICLLVPTVTIISLKTWEETAYISNVPHLLAYMTGYFELVMKNLVPSLLAFGLLVYIYLYSTRRMIRNRLRITNLVLCIASSSFLAFCVLTVTAQFYATSLADIKLHEILLYCALPGSLSGALSYLAWQVEFTIRSR